MKAIHVDFAPRSPQRVVASMRLHHWLLVGIGVVTGLGGIIASENLSQQQEARLAEMERVQARAAVFSVPPAESAKPALTDVQASAVNSTIRQLNLPWSRLLAAIEHATPASVAMLELEPDAKNHLLRGMAETETPEKMLAYIKRLQQEPFLAGVSLTKHEVSDQGANRPVRFEFEAGWLETVK